MNNHQTDLVIIGAGPTGLFSVFQAGMLKIKSQVIDSLEVIGGQCLALYPEKPIYDIPAYPKILASELIEKLAIQAKPFDPVYHLNQRVEKITKNPDQSFEVVTSKNTRINCRAIIIAAGCGAFGANRPPLDSIKEFEGKSVFYSVTDKKQFSDKNIVIAGGGDSAIDWAINLAEIAKKIFLIHRRHKFRCAPENIEKINNLTQIGKIETIVPFQLDSLKGENGYLTEVIVKDLEGNKKQLIADYLLAFFGLAMELGPIANWGLNLHKNHILVNQNNMQTSIAGIYAIGDIAYYQNKLKLILTGFSEAASAAHDIYKIIYPDKVFHFEYSTSKGIV